MASTVTLNGRTYAVDYGSEAYRRQSIPLLRRQSDSGDRPGSQSLNPEGPWRRTFESWHRGEGQSHADREASDPARFNDSFGVDVWDKYALRLLPSTFKAYTPDITIYHTLVVGNRLYVSDGLSVKFSDNPAAGGWTTVSLPINGVTRFASDGQTVWMATGGRLLSVQNDSNAGGYYGTSLASDVWYVKGRLITASQNGRTLSNVLNDVDPPVDLAVLPTGKWIDVTEGNGFIYAVATTQATANLRGTGQGTIFRVGIKADGTGLDVPVIAARLPNGEDGFSIFGYMGFVLIGTSRGVRFAQENGDGSLTLGSVRSVRNIAPQQGVSSFTAEDRFVYYGQSTLGAEADRAGLSRLDLSEFIAPLTPGAASDLATPAGTITAGSTTDVVSCGTYAGTQYFVISGSGPGSPGGIWMAQSAVASGTLSTGSIDYGISESKVPLYIDVQTEPLQTGTSVEIGLKIDGAASFTTVGTHNVTGGSAFTADISSQVIDPGTGLTRACRFFEVQAKLIGNGSSTPVVTRITLRAYPISDRGEIVQLPILLGEQQEQDGLVVYQDASAELAAIKALTASKQLVTLVEGDTSTQVYVEDYIFQADGRDEDGTDNRGTCILKLKSFA